MSLSAVSSFEIDHQQLVNFINGNNLAFRHLDWLSPIERSSQEGCFVIQANGEIKAILSCAPENTESAWIRFFYTTHDGQHPHYFKTLLTASLKFLCAKSVPALFALPQQPWMTALIEESHFSIIDKIVTLHLDLDLDVWPSDWIKEGLTVRQMTLRDLPFVRELDENAFLPEWQLNRESLLKTYQMAAYATVAQLGDRIAGYQITTASFDSAHLARLAVHPIYQRQGFGQVLITDLLNHCAETCMTRITVNTQARNGASLNLYQKNGFILENLSLPVYKLENI